MDEKQTRTHRDEGTTDQTEQSFEKHNVIASFADPQTARDAIDSLKDAGIDEKYISFLARGTEETFTPSERQDEEEAASHAGHDIPPDRMRQEDAETVSEVGGGVAKGSAIGGTAGATLGFIAGAIAFGIPGIGPAVGAGIWGATAGAAAAGATGGAVIGGFWKMRYRDELSEGRVLVGVHSGDEAAVEKAIDELRKHGPQELDRFDEHGELVPAN